MSKLTAIQRWAHDAVKTAINSGRLDRKPCETCGKPRAQAHHDDYLAPLDVRWLCVSCHHLWHARNTPRNIDAQPTVTEKGSQISAAHQRAGGSCFYWRGKARPVKKVS